MYVISVCNQRKFHTPVRNAKRIDGLRRNSATCGCFLWGLLCEGVALNLPQGTKFLDLYVFSKVHPNRCVPYQEIKRSCPLASGGS